SQVACIWDGSECKEDLGQKCATKCGCVTQNNEDATTFLDKSTCESYFTGGQTESENWANTFCSNAFAGSVCRDHKKLSILKDSNPKKPIVVFDKAKGICKASCCPPDIKSSGTPPTGAQVSSVRGTPGSFYGLVFAMDYGADVKAIQEIQEGTIIDFTAIPGFDLSQEDAALYAGVFEDFDAASGELLVEHMKILEFQDWGDGSGSLEAYGDEKEGFSVTGQGGATGVTGCATGDCTDPDTEGIAEPTGDGGYTRVPEFSSSSSILIVLGVITAVMVMLYVKKRK
ncbi:hypothetical protein KY311_02550, partial [Candidatus Woesearchaeota archaeon]|nr:hypothetical protein [Candidatus Woesearchaeota archaeon]